MLIESLALNDLKNVGHLQPEGWSDIQPDLAFYISSDYCNPIKMTVENSVAGIGASIQFTDTAWLAHIIVDAGFRNQGIGFQIVKRLLEDLEKSAIRTCLLTATELGKPVYLRAGFRTVADYIFLNRETPWQMVPVSSDIIGFREEFRGDVYRIDRLATGEDRAKLLSPFLKTARLFVRNHKVTGYLIPGLREGLIIAENEVAGFALMDEKYATVDRAVMPADNKAGIDYLLKRGFVDSRKKGFRMVRGENIVWKPAMIYSRIGGNVG